ncbi:MAG: PAS domain S-box protein, partial [Chitinivibrionales bacterium]|nr:PAS domain S-box protein [Chitinivibrionales bacterium]
RTIGFISLAIFASVINVLIQTRKKLRTERELLQTVLDSIPVMLFIYVPWEDTLQLNRAVYDTTGWTREDVESGDLMALLFPDPAYRLEASRYMHAVETGFRDLRMMTKGGEGIEVSWASTLTPDGRQIGIGVDVTERKRAETALRESREDLDRAQSVARTGSWRVRTKQRHMEWSDEVYRIFGIPREAPLSTDVFVSAIHPQDRELVDRRWQAALRGEPYDLEFRIVTAGKIKWVRERAELEFDEEGELIGALGITQDITARKRVEQQLKRSRDALAEANRELESFSYSVSHDLRNPLNNIGMMADVLDRKYHEALDDRGQRCVAEISSNSARMAGIITDLLTLSGISRHELELTQVDLSTMAGDIVRELRKDDPERAVEVIIHEHMWLTADPRLIRLAMENLVRNAWKYTSRAESPRIEIGARANRDHRIFFVKDNGAGFDMKDAERIFEPFTRVHSDREYRGTGVGLSIVQRVIRRHGGRVWAESAVGKGATFYFTLPEQRGAVGEELAAVHGADVV